MTVSALEHDISPQITSLSKLNISIPDDARQHLENQLALLYPHSETKSQHDNDVKAKRHLDDILKAMKSSPKITLCRVNFILTTRDDVIRELETILKDWKQERLKMMKTSKKRRLDGDDDLHQEIDLYIGPHSMFEDCIEIKWCHKDNSIAKGLVLSLDHSHPPLDTQTLSEPNLYNNNERLSNMSHEKRSKRINLGWPDTHRVIICDRFCGEAVLRGSDIFVRGILCADSGVRSGEEVAVSFFFSRYF